MCMLPFIAPKLVKSANKFPTAKTLIASPFLQKLPQWLAIFEMKPKLRRPFIRMSSHKARVGITFLICFLLSAAWKCNKKQWWRNEEDKSTVKIKWFKMNRKLWTRTWILATKNCIFLHLWIYSYFRVGDFGCFPFFFYCDCRDFIITQSALFCLLTWKVKCIFIGSLRWAVRGKIIALSRFKRYHFLSFICSNNYAICSSKPRFKSESKFKVEVEIGGPCNCCISFVCVFISIRFEDSVHYNFCCYL